MNYTYRNIDYSINHVEKSESDVMAYTGFWWEPNIRGFVCETRLIAGSHNVVLLFFNEHPYYDVHQDLLRPYNHKWPNQSCWLARCLIDRLVPRETVKQLSLFDCSAEVQQ